MTVLCHVESVYENSLSGCFDRSFAMQIIESPPCQCANTPYSHVESHSDKADSIVLHTPHRSCCCALCIIELWRTPSSFPWAELAADAES